MIPQEKTLLFFDDYLRGLGVDYMIFASALLWIVRDGHLNENEPSIDICVHGSDLNEGLMDKFKNSGYWRSMQACHKGYGEMYLARTETLQQLPGHIAITPLWKERGIVYTNPVGNECVVWPNAKYYDKESWSTIKYLGREFKAPKSPGWWLRMHYGTDWRTPLACSWRDNKNYKQWKEIW